MGFTNLSKLLRGRLTPAVLRREMPDRPNDAGFDENKHPRVPPGNPNGGQWTTLGDLRGWDPDDDEHSDVGGADFGDGPAKSPDGPPEGFQRVFDRGDFNVPITTRPRISGGGVFGPWLAAFNASALRDRPGGRQTFMELSRQDNGPWAFEKQESVTEEQFKGRCKKLELADRIAKHADALARDEYQDKGKQPTQPVFGTKVHAKAKDIVEAGKAANKSDFKGLEAELSIWDANRPLERLTYEQMSGAKAEARYGAKGTIRTDLIENLGQGAVCVYDIKTGREPLGLVRIRQILESVAEHYRKQREGETPITHILITTLHVPLRR